MYVHRVARVVAHQLNRELKTSALKRHSGANEEDKVDADGHLSKSGG
jgi:hypothetical protein